MSGQGIHNILLRNLISATSIFLYFCLLFKSPNHNLLLTNIACLYYFFYTVLQFLLHCPVLFMILLLTSWSHLLAILGIWRILGTAALDHLYYIHVLCVVDNHAVTAALCISSYSCCSALSSYFRSHHFLVTLEKSPWGWQYENKAWPFSVLIAGRKVYLLSHIFFTLVQGGPVLGGSSPCLIKQTI